MDANRNDLKVTLGDVVTKLDGVTPEALADCGDPVFIFRLPHFRNARFECRPISRIGPEKTVAFLYRPRGEGYVQAGVGVVEGGEWKAHNRKPIAADTLWAATVTE